MEAFLVLTRLGQYGALLPLLGLTAFSAYAPLTPRPGRGVLLGLSCGGLAATLLYLPALSSSMAGSLADGLHPEFLGLVISSTAAGWAFVVRVLVLAIAVPVAARSRRRPFLLASSVAVASLAFGGHANSGDGMDRILRLASDMLHLAAASLWIGALFAFLGLARRDSASSSTVAALEQFAGVGSVLVAVLIATGLINGMTIVGWPLPPMSGAWLWLMIAKLSLFGGMLVLAAANRFKLTPKLAGGASDSAVRHLRMSLILETSLGTGILILVAVLGTLMPPMVM